MKFKTLKTSATGIKLTQVLDQREEYLTPVRKILDEYNCREYWQNSNGVWGGIDSFDFQENPDYETFRNGRYGIVPNQRTKKGKELSERLKNLPYLKKSEFNNIIGYNDPSGWHANFGLCWSNPEYYLIEVAASWDIDSWKIPDDLIEITNKEFLELKEIRLERPIHPSSKPE